MDLHWATVVLWKLSEIHTAAVEQLPKCIFFGIHVNCTNHQSEVPKPKIEHFFFNCLEFRLIQLRFSTSLFVKDCLVHIRLHRRFPKLFFWMNPNYAVSWLIQAIQNCKAFVLRAYMPLTNSSFTFPSLLYTILISIVFLCFWWQTRKGRTSRFDDDIARFGTACGGN